MRNEIRSWAIFGIATTWGACLIGTGVALAKAPIATQPWFMLLFAAVFVAGMIGVMVALPEKE